MFASIVYRELLLEKWHSFFIESAVLKPFIKGVKFANAMYPNILCECNLQAFCGYWSQAKSVRDLVSADK